MIHIIVGVFKEFGWYSGASWCHCGGLVWSTVMVSCCCSWQNCRHYDCRPSFVHFTKPGLSATSRVLVMWWTFAATCEVVNKFYVPSPRKQWLTVYRGFQVPAQGWSAGTYRLYIALFFGCLRGLFSRCSCLFQMALSGMIDQYMIFFFSQRGVCLWTLGWAGAVSSTDMSAGKRRNNMPPSST